jgi:hypothetical protein
MLAGIMAPDARASSIADPRSKHATNDLRACSFSATTRGSLRRGLGAQTS